MKEYIEVIVPVYNVEKYLEKCVCSLINQSYKNYSIILVDDGSTDSSSQICDILRHQYPELIHTYHKKNGGLSDARNFGVTKSTAPYIVFVDSDDYVSNSFLDNLMNAKEKYNCDLVVSKITKVYETPNGTIKHDEEMVFDDIVMSSEQALVDLGYEKHFGSYAVSKLFDRRLLEQFPYPVGKFYEDSYTTYKQISECNTVVCIPNPGYFYLQRQGSIQRHRFERSHLDLVFATQEMKKFVEYKYDNSELIDAATYKLFRACHITLYHAIESELYVDAFKIVKKIMRENKSIIRNMNLSKKEKFIFRLMQTNTFIYKIMYRLKNLITDY